MKRGPRVPVVVCAPLEGVAGVEEAAGAGAASSGAGAYGAPGT